MGDVVPMPDPLPPTVCRACGGDKTAPPEFCWDCSQHVEKQRKAIADAKKAQEEHERAKRRVAFFSRYRKVYIEP